MAAFEELASRADAFAYPISTSSQRVHHTPERLSLLKRPLSAKRIDMRTEGLRRSRRARCRRVQFPDREMVRFAYL
jgi:hypothetical protein